MIIREGSHDIGPFGSQRQVIPRHINRGGRGRGGTLAVPPLLGVPVRRGGKRGSAAAPHLHGG